MHVCHAKNCQVTVPPRIFMCRKHWYMLPKEIRNLIWAEYRPGQEIDKRPSDSYLAIAKTAVDAVAYAELEQEPQGIQYGNFNTQVNTFGSKP